LHQILNVPHNNSKPHLDKIVSAVLIFAMYYHSSSLLPFPSPQMDYSVSESQTSTCLARNVPSLQPRGKFG